METVIYNIDSKHRNITSYPNSNNFSYNISEGTVVDNVYSVSNQITTSSLQSINKIEPFNEENVESIIISSIEIPNSFYYINETTRDNNNLTLDTTEKKIDDGKKYTKQTLTDAVNTALGGTISCTLDTNTNKITISNGTGGTIALNFSNTTDYLSLGQILGFTESSYNVANGSTITSENCIKNIADEYVFLKINDIGNITNRSKRYTSKIILDSDIFATTRNHQHQYITKEIKFSQPININKLEVGIYDYNNNLISLNGENFSFTLEINKVNNSILKRYKEILLYDDKTMEKILNAKMLQHYEKNSDNNLAFNYNQNLQNLHNTQEYNYNGNRNNYFK